MNLWGRPADRVFSAAQGDLSRVMRLAPRSAPWYGTSMTPEDIVESLVHDAGQATDAAVSGRYHLLAVIRDAARRVCTPRQCEAVLLMSEGVGTMEIARTMGITGGAVTALLYGNMRNGERVGGAMARLRKELAGTDLDVEPPQPVAVCRGLSPHWFRDARLPPDPMLFSALGLLALIVHLSDAKGTTRYADVAAAAPPQALAHLLPILRVRGYVLVDGPTIRIAKVPSDD